VIAGSPFACHQGEIKLEPDDGRTRITWSVRFRPRIPGTGALLQALFGRVLGSVMRGPLAQRIENP
jgi:carbon monoxide dehydrogenase subunit G